jgi:hypothetical protein
MNIQNKRPLSCTSFRDNIFAAIEKDYSSFSATEYDQHLQDCPDCYRLFEAFGKSLSIIEEDKLVEIDPFAGTRILQKIENYQEREPWWLLPVRPSFKPAIIGFGLIFALSMGILIGIQETKSGQADFYGNNEAESIRSALNVPDVMTEDIIHFSNQ